MNPPFSATPGIERIRHDADLRHIRSAFSMLPPGGRLAAITSAHCVPGDAAWRGAFAGHAARVVFTMAIDGRAYARRGTGFDTRLTVIERSARPGIDIDGQARAADARRAARRGHRAGAAAPPIEPEPVRPAPAAVAGRDLFGNAVAPPKTGKPAAHAAPKTPRDWGPVSELAVETAAPETGAGAPAAASSRRPLRAVAPERRAGAGRHRAPDPARAVRRDGRRVPSGAGLPPHAARARGDGRAAVRRPARERGIGGGGPFAPPRRRIPHRLRLGDRPPLPGEDGEEVDTAFVADDGETLSAPVRFRGAGCWATARARARAARSPPSCSTTGSAAASARSGSRSPTSSSRTRAATGPRSADATTTSSRSASSARARRSRCRRASCSRPTRRCARRPGRGSPRGSTRSSPGSRARSTRTTATPSTGR